MKFHSTQTDSPGNWKGELDEIQLGRAGVNGGLSTFLSQTAVPASSCKGKPLEAVWLPNEQVAKIWIEYVKNGTVADVTPPLPPFNVRVTSRGSGGNEITWDAEADFESCIGGFFVMRDNRALARLPTMTPPAVYGRPLFQGLSYHDTPEGPLPEMRCLDVSAKPCEKHTYSNLETVDATWRAVGPLCGGPPGPELN